MINPLEQFVVKEIIPLELDAYYKQKIFLYIKHIEIQETIYQ